MKMPYFRATVAAMIAVAGFAFCLPARASTFTVGGSGNTFTVSRSGAGVAAAETVRYRTVPLSAFPGQHYTEKSGTLVFAPGQPSTNITVSAATLSDGAYMYQTNVVRTYRFEILDEGGFPITNATRDVSTGLRQFKADKVSKSVTDLVTFSGGNFSSGMPSGKYLDVSYTPPSSQVETSGTLAGYVLIDDSYDYAQKPAMVSTAGLINSTGAQADYLAALDYKIYATVCFTEKERDDGYQYLQIVAGTSSASYDGADPNGQVNDPANSVYKVCFEFADGSNAEGKAFFPHRGTDTTEFSLSTGKLWQQKYKDGYAAGSSGSVVLPVSTSYITTRFDAGGDNDDTWGYKDFFVRMALVDNGQPTLYNNSTAAISVSPGPYSKGNAFYISVPFNEIVFSSGVKTISTTWGSADYCSGDGSNVITFKGTITADAGTVLSITGGTCNFRDFFDNYFQGSLNKTFNGKTVSASHAYPITYDLGGGTLPANAPTSYTYDAAVSLVQPTRTGYAFAGWTGTDLGGPTNEVTVAAGSTGDRSYVATWEANAYRVRFNDNDGSGATRDQEFIYDEPQSLDPAIARTGYDFAGWTGNADGSGDFYFGGQVVSNLTAEADGTVDLYAQWVGHSYIVRFDGNAADAVGCTDEMGMTYDVPDNLVSNAFTRIGYDFAGWSTNANGAVVYADGASVSNLTAVNYGSVMLYAQWTAHSYTVHFDPGGGEGSMPDQSFTYDTPQALSSNAFTRTGYAFIGWSVAGTTYPDGATVLNLTNAQDAVVSLVAKWGIPVPYIDADGIERICADYTILTNAAGGVAYGANGATAWYVVTNAVTISGQLRFNDYAAHLILCDGATLAVTNANGRAIEAGNLTIYGQTNGTGTVTANGKDGCGIFASYYVTINGGTVTANGYGNGIYAHGSVTINGGTVTATCSTGGYGIFAHDDITLGWTNPTDSITASSYYAGDGSVRVKTDQRLTDGSAIYTDYLGTHPTTLKGKTLRPAYSITLPEGVVAGGVVRQDGTTAYAIAGDIVTLSAATPGYAIGTVTVNGVPLEPVAGTYSFTASADVTIAATVTPVT
ncbi:MAG: InlB B-repeat-containing protein, partial [Kiritimatiellae bacterium]|nr:InlB B-repeat-containing protein [Kiritimatiellia bacterium]